MKLIDINELNAKSINEIQCGLSIQKETQFKMEAIGFIDLMCNKNQ